MFPHQHSVSVETSERMFQESISLTVFGSRENITRFRTLSLADAVLIGGSEVVLIAQQSSGTIIVTTEISISCIPIRKQWTNLSSNNVGCDSNLVQTKCRITGYRLVQARNQSCMDKQASYFVFRIHTPEMA